MKRESFWKKEKKSESDHLATFQPHKKPIFVSMDSSLRGSIKVVSFFGLVIKNRSRSIKMFLIHLDFVYFE